MNQQQDTSLPAIGRRARKPTLQTEPPRKSQAQVSLTLSKDKLLLLDLFSPDYYTVTPTQLRLSSDSPLPVTVDIETDWEGATVSPSEIVFKTEDQETEVMVFTSKEPTLTGAIGLTHKVRGSGETAALTAYYVVKTAFKVYTCGVDEKYQLATERAVKKFLEDNFPEEGPKKGEICEPIPEVIYANDDVLFHENHEDTTYCAVEPPAWLSLACGDSHALTVTSEGSVYSWGSGTDGQLGISLPKSQEIANTLAIKYGVRSKHTQSSSPYASHQSYSQLPDCYVPIPTKVTELREIVQVACGASHSLALTRNGIVLAFGEGKYGKTGLGHTENVLIPTIISTLEERTIVKVNPTQITTGYQTSFFIDSEGALFSCGAASLGALGHGMVDMAIPTRVSNIDPVHQCSSSESHTGVVTFEGILVMFGSTDEGRLGGVESGGRHSPSSFGNKRVRAVCCGGIHTHVLTEDLEVYSFGGNKKGQLGLTRSDFQYSSHSSLEQPMHNDYFAGKAVCFIAAGFEHSLALTLNGLIYAWGSNNRGQLGICTLGKDFKRVGLPRLLEANLKEPGTLLACGKRNTIFGVAGQHPDAHTYLFTQWKKKLVEEDRRLQERANYRYSIVRRQINYDKLSKRIQTEREQMLQRASPRFDKHESQQRKAASTSETYYEFWNFEKFVTAEDEHRNVYTFDRPSHEGKKGSVAVTLFKGIRPRKSAAKEPSTSSPNLRDAMNFASIDGSIALDQSLGVLSTPRGAGEPERPVYYERTEFEPAYRHFPTLRTQTMFYPYALVPNPMVIGATRRL